MVDTTVGVHVRQYCEALQVATGKKSVYDLSQDTHMYWEKTSYRLWEDGRRHTRDQKDNHSRAIIIDHPDIESYITRAIRK